MPKVKRRSSGGVVGQIGDARAMFANTGSIDALKPYIGKDGKTYIRVHKGGDPRDIKNYGRREISANATLRYDEWRELDRAVQMMARQKLVGFDDLRSRGLVYNLTNPMATTVVSWEEAAGLLQAVHSIDPLRKGDGDLPDHNMKHIPIPVTHADFSISQRLLLQSRRIGNGLDTSGVEFATRAVLLAQEDMLFGTTPTLSYGGGAIHSYLTHPDVNEYSFDSGGQHWNEAGTTGEEIVDDVQEMIDMARDSFHYGPFKLYHSSNFQRKMGSDYSVNYKGTIRQRILELEEIEDIQVVERLPADTVLLVQLTKDVVDLIDGMPIQTVQWGEQGGFLNHYKVMAIQIPRIKSKPSEDNTTRYSGIVVRSTESYK